MPDLHLTEHELDALRTLLATQICTPDFWPAATGKQRAAVVRVLRKAISVRGPQPLVMEKLPSELDTTR